MAALESPSAASKALDAEIIIVGGGLGGLGFAIELKKTGRESFIILERAGAVGGTWRDNIYPGCACDVPSMLYSFSFETYAGWTRTYPGQAELFHYIQRLANKHGLDRHIRLQSELSEARFEETTRTWALTLTDGTTLHTRVIVSAMGPLNKPNLPGIPGRASFAGDSFHSSAWDYSVDLNAKKVIVVGTGASAIQFVPHIAAQAGALTVFQRTAPWIIPRNDKPVLDVRRTARRLIPLYAWLVRKAIYWSLEIRALGFVVNPKLLELQERNVKHFIERSIPDPGLRAKMTPTYRAGCKRILLSDDYYLAIQRPNVEVVTEKITEIRAHSMLTSSGREFTADVIIYGTGFKATDGIAPVRVYGRGGIELGDAWRDGIQAYLGTTIAGFPNLFLVIGPNTGLGHNSMIFMMEAQYRYIVDAIDYLERSGTRAVDLKAEVMQAFNADLQKRMRGTVWATGCSSWYQDSRGKNVSLWPGFTFNFRKRTARFEPTRYRTI